MPSLRLSALRLSVRGSEREGSVRALPMRDPGLQLRPRWGSPVQLAGMSPRRRSHSNSGIDRLSPRSLDPWTHAHWPRKRAPQHRFWCGSPLLSFVFIFVFYELCTLVRMSRWIHRRLTGSVDAACHRAAQARGRAVGESGSRTMIATCHIQRSSGIEKEGDVVCVVCVGILPAGSRA